MKKSGISIAEKNLRTSLFTKGKLSKAQKVLAELLFNAKFGKGTFKQPNKIKVPSTWNVVLHTYYKELKYDILDKIETKMKYYFLIVSQEKHGETREWLRESVSDYFKDCVVNNTTKSKVLFKSRTFKVKVSFNHKRVTITNLKTKEEFVKVVTLDELILFNQVKAMIDKSK